MGLEERRRREGRAEREDGVLSANCSLIREERTMGGKNTALVSFSLTLPSLTCRPVRVKYPEVWLFSVEENIIPIIVLNKNIVD